MLRSRQKKPYTLSFLLGTIAAIFLVDTTVLAQSLPNTDPLGSHQNSDFIGPPLPPGWNIDTGTIIEINLKEENTLALNSGIYEKITACIKDRPREFSITDMLEHMDITLRDSDWHVIDSADTDVAPVNVCFSYKHAQRSGSVFTSWVNENLGGMQLSYSFSHDITGEHTGFDNWTVFGVEGVINF